MNEVRELLEAIKDKCNNSDCSKCRYATGIYMDAYQGFHYFCELRKAPRDWTIDREGPILRRAGQPVTETVEKKKQKKTRKKKVSK